MHVCLFCQSLSWYVLLAAVKTWLGCCLSCSCPLTMTFFLGENAVWSLKSPPAPPSSCFVSFHLVSFFFFFLLLSPMFSFGMTQLDVFKLKWKKKGFGVSPPAGQRKLPLKWGPPGLGILHTDSASSSDTSTCCVCCRSRTWLSKHVLSLSSVRVRRSSRTATVWEKRTNS